MTAFPMSVCLSVCLSVYLSLFLSLSPSVSICLPACLSVCLSAYLCVCVCVCVSLSLSLSLSACVRECVRRVCVCAFKSGRDGRERSFSCQTNGRLSFQKRLNRYHKAAALALSECITFCMLSVLELCFRRFLRV